MQTSIISSAELLRQELRVSCSLSYIDSVLNSSQTLLALIDDLLDVAKIESKEFILHFEPFNLQSMLQNICKTFQPLATVQQTEITLECKLKEEEMWVTSDPSRIKQVLVNLIGNAINFTPQGHVLVKISLEFQKYKFAILDDGWDIPEEFKEYLFVPCQQVFSFFTLMQRIFNHMEDSTNERE